MLTNFLVVIQILSGLAIVGLVLLQHGKGADMGASFGAGSSGSLFGATGSSNFLSKSTAACATVFFGCTLILALLASKPPAASEGGSILDRPAATTPTPEPTPSKPADLIPGASSSAPTPAAAPATPAPATAAPESKAPAAPETAPAQAAPAQAAPVSGVAGSAPSGK